MTHAFNRKICHRAGTPGGSWMYCAKCGLVLMRNDRATQARNTRCPGGGDKPKKSK